MTNSAIIAGASEGDKETDRNLSDVVTVKAMHLSRVAVNEEEPAETVLAEVVGETEQGDGGESRLKPHDHHLKGLNLIPIALRALAHGQRHKWRRHSNRREHGPRKHQTEHRVLVEP